MPTVTMKELLNAGVHFGHQTRRWNPKMRQYVYGARNGIYIIDLQKTSQKTKEALNFVERVCSEGKSVLFVGTKKQARSIIAAEAKRSEQYYVAHRWLGGMLTNYTTIRGSIDRLMKYEEILESDEKKSNLGNKEISQIRKKASRLVDNLGGIRDMKKLPGAVFVVDVVKEATAVLEARKLGIPVVGVVDTNSDPTVVDYPIPGNDDAIRSINLFARLVADACMEGRAQFKASSDKKHDDEVKVETHSRFEGDIDLEGIEEDEVPTYETSAEGNEEDAEAIKNAATNDVPLSDKDKEGGE